MERDQDGNGTKRTETPGEEDGPLIGDDDSRIMSDTRARSAVQNLRTSRAMTAALIASALIQGSNSRGLPRKGSKEGDRPSDDDK